MLPSSVRAAWWKPLLHEGVTYPRFANAAQADLLDAAPGVLEDSSTKVNDSSISALTGIHRKDVREWRSVGRPLPQAKTFGAVMEVFCRWSNDPAYCDSRGRPRILVLGDRIIRVARCLGDQRCAPAHIAES